MPNKKKKYNARFPPARIKKIMQTDEEVGKVAAAVPVIISRALELFVEALILKTSEITKGRNAKTLTSSHLKQCIQVVSQFDFLKDLVANVPDVQGEEDSNSTSSDSKPLRIKKHGKKERKKREAGTSKEDEDSITESSDIEDVSEDYDDDDEVEASHPNPTPTSNNSNAVNQMQTNSFSHPNFYNSNNNIDEDDYDA